MLVYTASGVVFLYSPVTASRTAMRILRSDLWTEAITNASASSLDPSLPTYAPRKE